MKMDVGFGWKVTLCPVVRCERCGAEPEEAAWTGTFRAVIIGPEGAVCTDCLPCSGPHDCPTSGVRHRHCRESCSACAGQAVRPCAKPHGP